MTERGREREKERERTELPNRWRSVGKKLESQTKSKKINKKNRNKALTFVTLKLKGGKK